MLRSQAKVSPRGPRMVAMRPLCDLSEFGLLARTAGVTLKGLCPLRILTKEPEVPWILPSAAALLVGAYFRISCPNFENAAMRSFRFGHWVMLLREKKPSSGLAVARHSWAISAQVAS